MVRNLFICLLLVCSSSFAQYSIKGTIDPDLNYSWILLYKLENGNQTYMDNADVVEGEFEFKIDEKEPSGVYRAYYQIENNLYVEFLYNKEKVAFSFNPNNPEESIQFSESEENNLTHNYYSLLRYHQKKIDSLQVLFFKSTEETEDEKISKKYQDELSVLREKQVQFEQASIGKLANHFIRASGNYNAEKPFKDPEAYINYIKDHFFDSIDPKDTVLSHSSFINDRLNDYVFYLNQADNIESKNLLQQEAIGKAVKWINNDYAILKNFEESLIQEYLVEENAVMINHVIDNYYNVLPLEYQNDDLKNRVLGALKTAVGTTAPDFKWEHEGEKNSLHQLSGTDYYIVLFFSADCPHCQIEIPEFYNFISGIENIKVIAVGLEDAKENWELLTGEYREFINILDLDKWSSTKVLDYGVTAIPSYFVLDANKTILAKPEDFNELKALFETK
jgi:peroxiredoxin/predicted transcriptional regulator